MDLWLWTTFGLVAWVALSILAVLLWIKIATAWKRHHADRDSRPRRRHAA